MATPERNGSERIGTDRIESEAAPRALPIPYPPAHKLGRSLGSTDRLAKGEVAQLLQARPGLALEPRALLGGGGQTGVDAARRAAR